MDARRVGRSVRALRLRLGWRQKDLAARSRVSQDLVSRLERGRIEGMARPGIVRVVAALDAEVVFYVRWRGGDLDRLLDRKHAAMNEQVTGELDRSGWLVEPEVSYSEYGERGSIDLLAWHLPTSTLLVIEVKSELTSIEETFRRHDAKVRLGAKVARERFGWRPASVVRLLVLPEATAARERVRRHSALFGRAYPLRGVELRRFLQHLRTASAVRGGLWFLRLNDEVRPTRRVRKPNRVVRPETQGLEPKDYRS